MYKALASVLILTGILVLFSTVSYAQAATRSKIEIVDAKLGKSVQDRVLVDEGTTFPVNSQVYLWLKTKGGVSESLTAVWVRKVSNNAASSATNATYVATSSPKLPINGSPWRHGHRRELKKPAIGQSH